MMSPSDRTYFSPLVTGKYANIPIPLFITSIENFHPDISTPNMNQVPPQYNPSTITIFNSHNNNLK